MLVRCKCSGETLVRDLLSDFAVMACCDSYIDSELPQKLLDVNNT
jgi:hypothetical protein